MTIYGLVFRLFGWAIGLGLITGQFTYYDDGHTDGWMTLAGIGVLILWFAPIVGWLRRRAEEQRSVEAEMDGDEVTTTFETLRLATFLALIDDDYSPPAAALASFAYVPLDDDHFSNSECEVAILKAMQTFTDAVGSTSPSRLGHIAAIAVNQYRKIAVEHGDDFYTAKFAATLKENAPQSPSAAERFGVGNGPPEGNHEATDRTQVDRETL